MEEKQMHKAVCAKCKEECEVPFEPTEGRDVLCQECFKKNRPQRRFGGRDNRRFGNRNRPPRQMHKAVCAKCKNSCEVPFKPTPGKEVLCQECFRASKQ